LDGYNSLRVTSRTVGLLCLGYGVTLLPPILLSLAYADGEAIHFVLTLGLVWAVGLMFYLPVGESTADLRRKDGFIIVAAFWIVLGFIGSLPFVLGPHLNFVDAVFETVSGLTTTGATTITGIDELPISILYYRQQIQWLGGMGLVVLAVAIMPMLGIGGMRMYRAEIPGPLKDEKIAPRLAHSLRTLWVIYVVLTVACALAYWLAGMSVFDAIAHSFSTVSTGGFSTHDASLGYYKSVPVTLIACLFMLLGGINFSIHFRFRATLNPLEYLHDLETRMFLLFVFAGFLILTTVLWITGEYETLKDSLVFGGFEVISVITSTGFGEADFSGWPLFLPVLLIFISFIGGCGGSTAGGMKVMRIVLLFKQVKQEVFVLLHPHSEHAVKIGSHVVSELTRSAVWGFFSIYVVTFVVLMLAMMAIGVDQVTAFSAIATCMNNMGPGLGDVAYTFTSLSDAAKYISAFAMLMGRLEIFTILVLLSPSFWRDM
jgi:trk system potassium uptake protein TrkH